MQPDVTPNDLAKLIRSRRTSMLVDKERAVPRELIHDLCELAQWAPNHKRTWPWRFAIADGDARAELGRVVGDAMQAHGDPPEKVDKARTKYLRTPSMLIVGSAAGDSPLRTHENRDAVAAGIQNLLLAATAHGLASYWSTCPKGANDPVAELCCFEPGTHVVAMVYLGWATRASSSIEPPARPAPAVHVVGEVSLLRDR